MQSQHLQPVASTRLYTIMTDATDREKPFMIYVGQWDALQPGALVVVDDARYQVERAAVTINRRGGQTQEVIVKRSR